MLNFHKAKLTHKRILLHLTLFLLLAGSIVLPAPVPSLVPVRQVEAQSCSPAGYYAIGGRLYYDWIANGLPTNSSCWNFTPGRAAVVQTTTCGETLNAWEFYYAGSVNQTFTIPNDWSYPTFNIQYVVDFIDPNDDPAWNRFEMEVWDQTTGIKLAYDNFNGGMGDLYCSNRSKSWSQNLAGHTILVRFKGSRGYSNTFIRVHHIYLFQRIG